ncbi:hypothetical protein ANCCAN_05637 [Ancylostoma caninum]|uniref:SCP-like protein n=1 Tax=Ancylostoma caninum TaxID=29170 RepID=A0A368GXP4_ANCCA|nr:hypothetical protein ANCCAN_05637 [Ancylostoma caninum]
MSLLLVLVLASAVLGQDQLACRTKQFQYCQTLLSSGVGLNDTMTPLMFKDYTVLYNWFLYKWGLTPGTTTNMLNVCNQLEFFNGCMASDRGCFAVQNLIGATDLNNAFAIDGTLAMYQFNCGPGLNTLLHEGLSCAQNIVNGYQNYLQACVTTYMSSITYDSNHGCNGGGQIPSPDCRRAGAADIWWACEANRVFTLNQFPNCGYTCDVQQQSGLLASHLATHHKVENGVHYYRVPDYVTKINGKLETVQGAWMSS